MVLLKVKEWVKEHLFLVGYFLFTLFIFEPINLIRDLILSVGDLVKGMISIFSIKEEKKEYKRGIIFFLIMIVILLLKGDIIIFGKSLISILIIITILVFILKIKNDGKYKEIYRKKFIYKRQK